MNEELLDEVARDFIAEVRDHPLGEMRKLILGKWPDAELYRLLTANGFTDAQVDVLWQFVINSTDNTIGFFLKYVDVIMARGQLRGELRTREGERVAPIDEIYEMDKLFDFEWRERFGKYAHGQSVHAPDPGTGNPR